MRSQEFQIEQGNCGDYWGVAHGFETIPARKATDSTYEYDPAAQPIDFGGTDPRPGDTVPKKEMQKIPKDNGTRWIFIAMATAAFT